jgi:hypothetical protein
MVEVAMGLEEADPTENGNDSNVRSKYSIQRCDLNHNPSQAALESRKSDKERVDMSGSVATSFASAPDHAFISSEIDGRLRRS